jgi:tagatose 1,6-diphosphate aldolase/sulfofructosephosphate aldolase
MTQDTGTAAATLADIASPDGTFAVVAMDQRNTLKKMYAAIGNDAPAAEELVALKADVVAALSPLASAFLLDPTYGIPALHLVEDRLVRPLGVLVAAEAEKRPTYEGEPRAAFEPTQDAQWVLDLGGVALKFLVQVRADRPPGRDGPDLASEAIEVIRRVVEDCRATGVPSVIENLVYPLPGETLGPEERAEAVIGSARALDALGPDLLKLEYPGSPEACRRLADSISAPWAVLSAGVGFDEFAEVLRISCDEGGASGFIAGRAVWKDAVGMEPAARRAYLESEGRRRLEGCLEAISGRARPWHEVVAS